MRSVLERAKEIIRPPSDEVRSELQSLPPALREVMEQAKRLPEEEKSKVIERVFMHSPLDGLVLAARCDLPALRVLEALASISVFENHATLWRLIRAEIDRGVLERLDPLRVEDQWMNPRDSTLGTSQHGKLIQIIDQHYAQKLAAEVHARLQSYDSEKIANDRAGREYRHENDVDSVSRLLLEARSALETRFYGAEVSLLVWDAYLKKDKDAARVAAHKFYESSQLATSISFDDLWRSLSTTQELRGARRYEHSDMADEIISQALYDVARDSYYVSSRSRLTLAEIKQVVGLLELEENFDYSGLERASLEIGSEIVAEVRRAKVTEDVTRIIKAQLEKLGLDSSQVEIQFDLENARYKLFARDPQDQSLHEIEHTRDLLGLVKQRDKTKNWLEKELQVIGTVESKENDKFTLRHFRDRVVLYWEGSSKITVHESGRTFSDIAPGFRDLEITERTIAATVDSWAYGAKDEPKVSVLTFQDGKFRRSKELERIHCKTILKDGSVLIFGESEPRQFCFVHSLPDGREVVRPVAIPGSFYDSLKLDPHPNGIFVTFSMPGKEPKVSAVSYRADDKISKLGFYPWADYGGDMEDGFWFITKAEKGMNLFRVSYDSASVEGGEGSKRLIKHLEEGWTRSYSDNFSKTIFHNGVSVGRVNKAGEWEETILPGAPHGVQVLLDRGSKSLVSLRYPEERRTYEIDWNGGISRDLGESPLETPTVSTIGSTSTALNFSGAAENLVQVFTYGAEGEDVSQLSQLEIEHTADPTSSIKALSSGEIAILKKHEGGEVLSVWLGDFEVISDNFERSHFRSFSSNANSLALAVVYSDIEEGFVIYDSLRRFSYFRLDPQQVINTNFSPIVSPSGSVMFFVAGYESPSIRDQNGKALTEEFSEIYNFSADESELRILGRRDDKLLLIRKSWDEIEPDESFLLSGLQKLIELGAEPRERFPNLEDEQAIANNLRRYGHILEQIQENPLDFIARNPAKVQSRSIERVRALLEEIGLRKPDKNPLNFGWPDINFGGLFEALFNRRKSAPEELARYYLSSTTDAAKLRGGDPKAPSQELLRLREPLNGLLMTRLLGKYEHEAELWHPSPLSMHKIESEASHQVTASINLPTAMHAVSLPCIWNGEILKERVVGVTEEGVEHNLELVQEEGGGYSVKPRSDSVRIFYTQAAPVKALDPSAVDERGYGTFLSQLPKETRSDHCERFGILPPDLKEFAKSIGELPPLERILRVLGKIKEIGFYDMRHGEVMDEWSEISATERFQLMQLRAQTLRTSGEKMEDRCVYAGVCADFAILTSCLLREVGIASGIAEGFLVDRKSVGTGDSHAAAFALYPDLKAKEGYRLILVDTTPSNHRRLITKEAKMEGGSESAERSQADSLVDLSRALIDPPKGSTGDLLANVRNLANGRLEALVNALIDHELSDHELTELKNFMDQALYTPWGVKVSEGGSYDEALSAFYAALDKDLSSASSQSKGLPAGYLFMNAIREYRDFWGKHHFNGAESMALDFMQQLFEGAPSVLSSNTKYAAVVICEFLKGRNLTGKRS